jgi:asparagine synthase (glutamine-hydrolysing)
VIDAPFDELAGVVRERLLTAVRRRLPGDGTVGLLLSGGLDSTVVGAALRALDPRGELPLRAYSGLFPANPEIDERAGIETMARWLDVPLVRSRIAGGRPLIGVLEHVAAWRLPSTAPNVFLWTPLLQQAAADGVLVMLDGEGGDEIFGIVPYLMADLVRRGLLGRARGVAARVPGVGGRATTQQLDRLVRHYALPAALPWQAVWLYRRARTPGRYAPRYIQRSDARIVRAVADPWRWLRRDGPRWWAHLAHLLTDERESLDAHGFLHRRARQFGLTDAHPLLDDVELVELALALPPEVRLDPEHDRPLTRAAMRGLMPEELRMREGKSYFTNLLGEGLRGPDASLAEEVLRPGSALIGEFTDHARLVSDLLDTDPERYPRGRIWWASDLWRAASIEIWLRDPENRGWAARALREGGPAVDQELED